MKLLRALLSAMWVRDEVIVVLLNQHKYLTGREFRTLLYHDYGLYFSLASFYMMMARLEDKGLVHNECVPGEGPWRYRSNKT